MGSNPEIDEEELYPISTDDLITLLPATCIRVINPRTRNKTIFAQLVENISVVGLKRPVTVALGTPAENEAWYELLCGQGRFEALQALGEEVIPCRIVKATRVDRFLITLTENIARRRHTTDELLQGIRALRERGYTSEHIASKTNLNQSYVQGILHLLENGERRLISAVESRMMPISLAIEIARSPSEHLQAVLQTAYETGTLRGVSLIRARRLISRREAIGKGFARTVKQKDREKTTPAKLLRTYQTEVNRQKIIVQKANIHEQRLLLMISALKQFLADEHFRTMLRAEGIRDIPKPIADRLPAELMP